MIIRLSGTKNDYTVISYDVLLEFSMNQIQRKFTSSSCRTGDSIQGITIDTSITMYDWNFYYASREWVWTAITRATDFKDVFFYKGFSVVFEQERLKTYFRKKIKGYVDQDTKASRAIKKDNCIIVEWLIESLAKSCISCGCTFSHKIVFDSEKCNLTANRKDNNLGHELDNIEPMCDYCNSSLSDRSYI